MTNLLTKQKKEIQGVINTSWTLHKSNLLQLIVDELEVTLSHLYDEIVLHSATVNKKKQKREKNDLYIAKQDEDEEDLKQYMKDLEKLRVL